MPNHSPPIDTTFRALADPTRRAVLQRLTHGPATVTELAEPFDMALPSFLQHLRLLEAGGLVTTVKRGRTRTCELRPEPLAQAADWLTEQKAVWESRFDRMDAYLLDLHAKEKSK